MKSITSILTPASQLPDAILNRVNQGVTTIYLDYAAATPLDAHVLDAMQPYFSDAFYNPSAPYAPAVAVRRDLQSAKQQIARIIGAQADDIIITAGATESINLAMTAAGDGHIVTSAIEHDAVLAAAGVHDHTIVAVTSRGVVQPETIEAAITSATRLVSIGLANHEIGTVQSLSEIANVVMHERLRRLEVGDKTPIWLHTDASQCAGQIDINVARRHVDLMTLNAAKIYGPKQVGLLWYRPGVILTPLIYGGGQEAGLRSGTENVAGTIGFAVALELAEKRRKGEARRLEQLRDDLERRLITAFPDAIVSGHPRRRLPGNLHISFPDLDAERLVFLLEAKNIFVATGSACAANKNTRSHVLEAIGLEPQVADGSLRLTLGRDTTSDMIATAASEIISAIQGERKRVQP